MEPESWGFLGGFLKRAHRRRTPFDRPGWGQTKRGRGRVRQDDGQGDSAGSYLKGDWRRPAIITTAGGTRQLIVWLPNRPGSLDPATGKHVRNQATKVGASMTVATGGAERLAPVRLELLQRRDDDGPRRQETCRDHAVEGKERQRDRHRHAACRYRDAGCCRRSHLRPLQLRSVPLPAGEDGNASLGVASGDERNTPVGRPGRLSGTASDCSSTTIAAVSRLCSRAPRATGRSAERT